LAEPGAFPRRHARTRGFTLGRPRGFAVGADGARVAFLRSAAGDDPVNRRLFPPAYLEPEDAERDAEYRRLMHDELVQAKLANVELVAGTLAKGSPSARRWTVDLTEEEATAWLGVLNDLRLALGVRLEITEDFDGQVDDTDPRAPAMHLLAYLGWLEEHLLEALAAT
jgi:hypothetical protein